MPIGRMATIHLAVAEYSDNQQYAEKFTCILMDKGVADPRRAIAPSPESVAVTLMTGMDIFATVNSFDMSADSADDSPLRITGAKPMFAAPKTISVVVEGVIHGIWRQADPNYAVHIVYLFPGMLKCYVEKYITYDMADNSMSIGGTLKGLMNA